VTSLPDHNIAQPPSALQITEDLVRLVDEMAGIRIDHETGLLASGLTSANLVTLTVRATDRWHVDIPVEVLFRRGTVASLADYVHTALTQTRTPPSRRGDTSLDGHCRTGSAAQRKALRNQIRAAVGKIR
jgi:hypothetical protein